MLLEFMYPLSALLPLTFSISHCNPACLASLLSFVSYRAAIILHVNRSGFSVTLFVVSVKETSHTTTTTTPASFLFVFPYPPSDSLFLSLSLSSVSLRSFSTVFSYRVNVTITLSLSRYLMVTQYLCLFFSSVCHVTISHTPIYCDEALSILLSFCLI